MSDPTDELEPRILDALVAGLPAVAVGGSLRTRLLSRVTGTDRYLPFLDRVAEMFDLPEAQAQDHLHSIDRPDDWDDMLPGVRFRDFDGGPALGEAHGGLIRLQPGTTFPQHTHIGRERVLILQGRMEDDTGKQYRAGDLIVSEDGTAHEFRAIGDQEVIYAAAVIALEFPLDDDDDD
jgi:anti-sigma factor ChrR (cupin superfamily)